MRLRAFCITTIVFFAATVSGKAQWIEAKSAHYSIFYPRGYEDDFKFTRTWLDRAEGLLKDKYGVLFSGFYISFYLYPAPTQIAGVGLANLHCCSNGANGVKNGTISYLAPSAPAWTDAPPTSLGLPKDDNYHAKVIMSEFITVGHYIVQESRATTGAWRYYSAPKWFVQGLQEYDGIFHTTDTNRKTTGTALLAWAKSHPSAFECCGSGLQISDVYNGGATFVTFLAAKFGEDIHARLLRDDSSTFMAALENQTKPNSLQELFTKFQAWLAAPTLPAR